MPGLTDADKAKIMEMLKLAREEAIDGGSANEKSDIFQMYKNQINDYLEMRTAMTWPRLTRIGEPGRCR